MFKILAYGSIVSAALLATAATGQAREYSVWGHSFTTDDAPIAVPVAPAGPRFGATVAHPERFLRRTHRLDNLN